MLNQSIWQNQKRQGDNQGSGIHRRFVSQTIGALLMDHDLLQEFHDKFYFQNGPCCSGCDWWQAISSGAGECTKSAPVPGEQRMAMLGVSNCSLRIGAGHPITRNNHHCGDFKDEFDWFTLPLGYRARVGAPTSRQTS